MYYVEIAGDNSLPFQVHAMPSVEEITRRTLDLLKRARDVPLMLIPGYMEWSEQKLAEGVPDVLIAHMDGSTMWQIPEDIDSVSTEEFEVILDDLDPSTAWRDNNPPSHLAEVILARVSCGALVAEFRLFSN